MTWDRFGNLPTFWIYVVKLRTSESRVSMGEEMLRVCTLMENMNGAG